MPQNSPAPEGCGQNRALRRCETCQYRRIGCVSRLALRGFGLAAPRWVECQHTLALRHGCELDPIPNSPGRYCIRAIGYDADPAKITDAQLFQLTEEQFLAEWMPERYYGH